MRGFARWVAFSVVVTAVPVVALASRGGPGKLEQLKEQVGVDDATAARVRAIFDQDRESRHAAHLRQRNAREKVEALVRANSNDDAAYRAALDELQSARDAVADLRKQQVAAIRQVLTPAQQARLLVAMEERGEERRQAHGRRGGGN